MAWIKMIVMEVNCSGDIRQIFRANVEKVDLTDGKDTSDFCIVLSVS